MTRQARVKRALDKVRQLGEEKPAEAEEVRASTTDSEARVMKMADGGFRPAYNAQLAADVGSQVIVGVDLTDAGSDLRQLSPMLEQIGERYGVTPSEMLVDGGFASLEAIEQADSQGCRVYAPPMKPRDGKRNPHRPMPGDSPAIARWRRRMGLASAKEKYKDRALTSECVNAQARKRGLQQFPVRGRRRARCVLLLHALTHNMTRWAALLRLR